MIFQDLLIIQIFKPTSILCIKARQFSFSQHCSYAVLFPFYCRLFLTISWTEHGLLHLLTDWPFPTLTQNSRCNDQEGAHLRRYLMCKWEEAGWRFWRTLFCWMTEPEQIQKCGMHNIIKTLVSQDWEAQTRSRRSESAWTNVRSKSL